jgi:hypothetical protein
MRQRLIDAGGDAREHARGERGGPRARPQRTPPHERAKVNDNKQLYITIIPTDRDAS